MSRPAPRKALAPAPRACSERPRDPIARTAPPARAGRYPSLAEIAQGDLATAVRAFARVAACAGIVGAATLAAGCEDPQCSTSRLGELEAHGPGALSRLVDLKPVDAAENLGVGFGIVPHPAPSFLGGEAPFVGPAPAPAPPSPVPSGPVVPEP